ncbi:T9SS type A sorting domain-containing protein [Bacteroidota bacterium]
MKRFFLLFIASAFVLVSFGQKIEKGLNDSYENRLEKPLPIKWSNLKADGDVFWLEEFDWENPDDVKGWTLPDGYSIVDLSEEDFGHTWMWRAGDDSITGIYTFEKGHAYSKSPDNGFLVLPMDEFNSVDGINTSNAGNCYIEFPPVDCSDHETVVLAFQQYFRFNGNSARKKVLITVDEGVHWAEYLLYYDTPTNQFCINPNVEINISDIAGGQSGVILRIHWEAGSRYFLAIDDMCMYDAYHNDILIENQWSFVNNNIDNEEEGYYSWMPFNQIGNNNFGAFDFKAAVLNMGTEDAAGAHLNVEILKNGVSVYNENSAARNMDYERDTFYIETQYMADDYGDYQIALSAVESTDDQRLSNNTSTMLFTVNDSIYARDDNILDEHTGTHHTGNDDGDVLGLAYQLDQPAEANSISVYISQRWRNPYASTRPGFQYLFSIWYVDPDDELPYELIASDMFEITEEDLNTWVTLPLQKDGEVEFLEPGLYYACIEMWTGGGVNFNNNEYRFTIGRDMTNYIPENKTVSIDGYEDLTFIVDLPMIRLNLNYSGGPTIAPVTYNVDMNAQIAMNNFDPANDFVDVSGTFNDWGGSEHMTDADADGVYTITIPDLSYLENIEYKYRINGTSSETGSREYQIRYWNVLNDLYNNELVGIDFKPGLTSDVNVYPNPASDMLNIIVNNKTNQDLDISISNIQGQVVYQNHVNSVISHQEKVDISRFSKGIYFLRVNKTVNKVIVQ